MSRVLGVEYFCWVSCCAQRKSQTSMKILISGFNVCANAHGSSREDIFKTIN